MLVYMTIGQAWSEQAIALVIVQTVVHARHGAQSAGGVIEEVCSALQRERKWTTVPSRFPESGQTRGQAASDPLSQVEVFMLGISEEAVIAPVPSQQDGRGRTNSARNADHSERGGTGERLAVSVH